MANEQQPISPEQLAREKALYVYLSAFERGDFDTMNMILQEAMHDADLEQMIIDAHDYYLEEEQFSLQEEEIEQLRQLIWQHLPSAVKDEEEEAQIPPLTVDDVLARMQEQADIRGALRQELQQLIQQCPRPAPELPTDLGMQSLRHLFEQSGLQPGLPFLKHFRHHALMLALQRNQGLASLAAARRQKAAWRHRQEQQRQDKKPKPEA